MAGGGGGGANNDDEASSSAVVQNDQLFGGAPTFEEATQATNDLNNALENLAYLRQSSVSEHVVQAFRLVKNVVASLASDPALWNAALNNNSVVNLFQTSVLPELESPEAITDNNSESGIRQKISRLLAGMMNSLIDLFRGSPEAEFTVNNPDGIPEEQTSTAKFLMQLAIMVMALVVFGRA